MLAVPFLNVVLQGVRQAGLRCGIRNDFTRTAAHHFQNHLSIEDGGADDDPSRGYGRV